MQMYNYFSNFAETNDIYTMEEKKYNFRSYIKEEANKAKEEEAQKNWKRNVIGIILSSILFLIVILCVLFGMRISYNLSVIGLVLSMTGVFYFSRELRILPKGQLIASGVKTGLCWLMGTVYLFLHQGSYDSMDGVLLLVLFALPLLDLPKVIRAWRQISH